MNYKLGSLFDGSGGFPLAGSLCGIEPVWASEVEPYPIAVTRSRFPNMKHLGDISKVRGGEIEPVDIITFGSPCQDLSVAGKRAGLKHTDNGDEETTRSGLFMEAVRIIKEMREATNGEYPTFAVWENVPGAFSSNKGDDFRVVLEELIKIVEPTAVMPAVPKNGWAYSDSYVGDGWSLAYRVFDAQYWGVTQRRRRIYLVADFRGECAEKVLFERDGLRGYFAEGRTPWQGAAADVESGAGAADREGAVPYTLKIRSGCDGGGKGALVQVDKSATLATNNDQYLFQPIAFAQNQRDEVRDLKDKAGAFVVCMATQQGGAEIMENLCPTITASAGMSGNNQPVVCMAHGQANAEILEDKSPCLNCNHEQPIIFDKEVYNSGENATGGHYISVGGPSPTLRSTGHPPGVSVHYIVRRLTPTECARLQGFPDDWGHPDHKEDFTDDEYRFWLNVRNTHAAVNGKPQKDYTKVQILTWYNGLHTDSSEYKMWGNGIALPCALYVMQGIQDALEAGSCGTVQDGSEKKTVSDPEKEIMRGLLLDIGRKLEELEERIREVLA